MGIDVCNHINILYLLFIQRSYWCNCDWLWYLQFFY